MCGVMSQEVRIDKPSAVVASQRNSQIVFFQFQITMKRLTALTVVTTVLLVATVSAASLQQLFVVHRHGARSPLPSVNQSALCPGGAAGCGILTLQGKTTLNNLGLYLREQYNDTIQPYSYYDADVVYTRSTDVDRTIQSAGAMLSGLYQSLEGTSEEVYPVIHTREVKRDTELLVWDGWPSLVIWSATTGSDFFAMVSELILQNIINATELAAIGAEIGLSEECDPQQPGFFPFACAVDSGDYFSWAITVGKGDAFPITRRHYPQLVASLELYNQYAMGTYDEVTNGGKFIAAVGTFGYPLMMDILGNMQRAPWNASQPSGGGRRLSHYSGHDVTLMPLCNTLGNDTMLNPVFGAAMIFELWGGEGTDAFVVAKFGQPGQTPDSNYTYAFENFTLTCVAVSGAQYTSSTGCPLADLLRYVSSRGPNSPMGGPCYTSNDTQAMLSCTPTQPAPPVTYCRYYRSMCLNACGESGAMLANYSCVVPPPGASHIDVPLLATRNGRRSTVVARKVDDN